jgi:hypothetical protein
MVRFIEDGEVVTPRRHGRPAERFIRSICGRYAGPRAGIRPHLAQRRGPHDEWGARISGECERDVRFSEPDVVGDERSAVLSQRDPSARDRLPLVFPQCDAS